MKGDADWSFLDVVLLGLYCAHLVVHDGIDVDSNAVLGDHLLGRDREILHLG